MDRKWVLLGLIALNLLLWGQSAGFEFVTWDDPDFLTANPNVLGGLTPSGIGWALTAQTVYWQPLVYLSHMTMVSLFGLQPGPHHLLNAMLHAASAGIFFLVLTRMRFPVWTAAIAVAIYSLHPLRAESVAWVTERKDVLSGLFWWLAILAYLRYAQEGKRYLWVGVFFALALMTKPVAVTLPVVLLLLDYWPLRRLDAKTFWARVVEKMPLAALSAGSVLLTVTAQKEAMSAGIGMGLRLVNAVHSYGVYLGQTIWPNSLAALYAFPDKYPAGEIAALLVLFGAAAWAAWAVRERQPWWIVAWAWYAIVLLPNAGIVQVGPQPHADRYSYLPTSMLIAGVCYGIGEWARGRHGRMAGWVGVGLAVVYCLASGPAMGQWRNDYTLYGRMLEMDSRLFTAHNNLGLAEKRNGNMKAALQHFKEATRLDPTLVEAQVNAATAYADIGQPALALPHARKATELAPGRAETWLQLGRAQTGLDQLDDAIQSFRKGISLSKNPGTAAPLYMQLGIAEYMRKNDEAALAAFRGALAAEPRYLPARKNAAIALGNLGRTQEAIAEFEAYLQASPGDTSVRQAIDALRAAPAKPEKP